MAEDTTSQDAAQQSAEAQTDADAEEVKSAQADASEDKTDWKAEARKWEARARENKAAAERLAELEKQDEAAKSDLEKATQKAEKALKELADMKAAQQRAEWVKAAAKSHGVDEELLSMMTGDGEDEINANAKTLKAKMDKIPKYPDVQDKGSSSNSASGMTKKEILAIKNPREQLKAAAQNIHAFD